MIPRTLPASSALSPAFVIQQLHVRKSAFGAAQLFQTQLQADSEGKREGSQGNEQPAGESPAQVRSDQVGKGAPKDGKDQRWLHQGVQPLAAAQRSGVLGEQPLDARKITLLQHALFLIPKVWPPAEFLPQSVLYPGLQPTVQRCLRPGMWCVASAQ